MAFADTFKALSDPVRREILTMLKDGRMSAGDIGSRFDMTGATVSYHLNILKKAGLVYEEKEKNFVFYNLVIDNRGLSGRSNTATTLCDVNGYMCGVFY